MASRALLYRFDDAEQSWRLRGTDTVSRDA
jgi:hypothetical protein